MKKNNSSGSLKVETTGRVHLGAANKNSNLTTALAYLQDTVLNRLKHYVEKEAKENFSIPDPPVFNKEEPSAFTSFLNDQCPDTNELLVLLMALAPQIYPNFFDAIIARFLPKGGDFPEFGGVKGREHRGTMPTGETVLFILAGNDLNERLRLIHWLKHNPFFNRDRIVVLDPPEKKEPIVSGRLTIDGELLEWVLTETVSMPKLGTSFPAKYITTGMEWEDLILPEETLARVKDLENWIHHNNTLLVDWGMHRKIKPGYRVLFYGPPGTGKTLTATLLGKYTNRPVFKIDLSMIVSKYIGETEKNLSSLFDKAQNKNWILFFDEADAIFGKRTNVRDAHDKYANQEVSYLLQRIEDFSGLVILATNFLSNIDNAFRRRFNALVKFPMPTARERKKIWSQTFPGKLQYDSDLIEELSHYELSGGNIINAVHYASLKTLAKQSVDLKSEDALEGVEKELIKEGKHFKKP